MALTGERQPEPGPAGQDGKRDLLEDLCFDCQQAGEKSLKAMMILNHIVPLPTHSISILIEALEEHKIPVPDEVKEAVSLSYYAVTTRYPGHYEPINQREYKTALKMADTIVTWVEKQFSLSL